MNDVNEKGTVSASSATPAAKPGINLPVRKIIEEIDVLVMQSINELLKEGALVLPSNYAYGNALKLAYLYIQDVKDKNDKPALEVCTRQSIANALLKMVINGLSVAKKQCYFIVYGNTLSFQEDYRGNLLIAKRDADVKELNPNVIYEGDEFSYIVDVNTGRKKLLKHECSLENQSLLKIRGAYAITVYNDGTTSLEVMNIEQIKDSWLMGKANGNSKAHNKFTDQMCLKTVSNRASKVARGSSDDSGLMPHNADIQTDEAQEVRDKAIEQSNNKHLSIEETNFEEVRTSGSTQHKQVEKEVGAEVPAGPTY